MTPTPEEKIEAKVDLGNTEKEDLAENKPVKKKKRFKEGRRLKTLPPMSVFVPFIMQQRNDACNLISDTVELDAIDDYIFKKRAEGYKGFGIMHVMIAAYVHALAEKPGVNRFIRRNRVWSRNNIEIVLTIKKQMKLNAPDTIVKIFPEPTDTAEDIYKRINSIIAENKEEDTESNFDKTAKVLTSIPAFLIRGAVGILKIMEFYGIIPRFLTQLSPFHGSLCISSVASLGIPPVYHHIYNFGNVPVYLSYGTKRSECYIDNDGSVKERKMLDFKVVTDERICDGYYYAAFLRTMKSYLKNPDKLDFAPAKIIPDID